MTKKDQFLGKICKIVILTLPPPKNRLKRFLRADKSFMNDFEGGRSFISDFKGKLESSKRVSVKIGVV